MLSHGSAALPFVIPSAAEGSAVSLHRKPMPCQQLLSAVLENLFRQVILHVRLIAHDFVISGSQ
jgi:hypothetical protein